ncbi:MAG: glycosyltransferase, partial [Bacteroidota bacterium]
MRARMAGFSLAIVPSAFVFHHGSRTFNDQGIDHVRLMLRNEKIFFDRVYSFSAQLPFVTHRSERQDPPLVSVIVRTKDRPHLLQQALASLANQTFNGFEAVVV